MSGPQIPQKTMKLSLSGSARADFGKEDISANLQTKVDQSTIKAKVGMVRVQAPAYKFDVDIDQINLDRYLPPKRRKPRAASRLRESRANSRSISPPQAARPRREVARGRPAGPQYQDEQSALGFARQERHSERRSGFGQPVSGHGEGELIGRCECESDCSKAGSYRCCDRAAAA